MAHNVTGASLTPIYDRLNAVPNYHPLDAETFGDWAMQAGDIVTVTRDGRDYSSPVFAATHVWRGKPSVTINSSGNQHRDPVTKVAKRKYGGGGAGMRNDMSIHYDIYDESGLLHTSILATERQIELVVAEERERAEGAETTLTGRINVESVRITQEVEARQSETEYLAGRIVVESGRITQEVEDRTSANTAMASLIESLSDKVSIVVTQKDGQNIVDAASIVAGINDQTGSYVRIAARNVNLDGYVKATDITTDYLAAKIADIPTLNGLAASFSGNVSCSGLLARQVYVGASGGPYTNISNPVMYVTLVSQPGSTYKLTATKADGTYTDFTFSRATSLSGAWSGNTYTVTAAPQGNTDSVTVNTVFGAAEGQYFVQAYQTNLSQPAPISGTSKNYKLGMSGTTVQVQQTNGTQISNTPTLPINPLLQQKTISANGTYTPDEGYIGFSSVEVNSVSPGSVTILGSWSGTTYTAVAKVGDTTVATAQTNISLIAQGGGTSSFSVLATTIGSGGGTGDVHASKSVELSMSGTRSNASVLAKFDGTTYGQLGVGSLYTAGVAAGEGKFSSVSVTQQGSQAAGAYIESSTLGLYYYQSAGTTKYDRGSAVTVTPIGTSIHFSATSVTPIGASSVFYAAGTTTRYYNAGTVTKYDRGSTVTVTPIGAGIVLSQATRYTLGTSGTYYAAGTAKTYYNAGTTTKYDRGTTVTVHPAQNPTYFTTVTRYTAGTATTYYKGDGGTYTARGDSVSVTPIGTSKYFYTYNNNTKITLYKLSNGSYVSAGNRFWFYATTSGGGAFYNKGTAATYYKGNGGTVYGRGTSVSVTPIGTGATYYQTVPSSQATKTFFDAGGAVTYYNGNGGSFTVQGTAVTVTPIGTAYTRYTLGTSETVYVTAASGTTYHKAGAAVTYYRGDGGSFTVQGTSVSVTPIGSSYVRYAAGTAVNYYSIVASGGATYYSANPSQTYYAGDGGAFTPIDASTGKRLLISPLYHLGSSSTYYQKIS